MSVFVCFDAPVLFIALSTPVPRRVGFDMFKPAWNAKGVLEAVVGGRKMYCFQPPSEDRTVVIVRSGRGWGRRGGAEYYMVTRWGAVRLRKKPTRKLGVCMWMDCLYDGDRLLTCIE